MRKKTRQRIARLEAQVKSLEDSIGRESNTYWDNPPLHNVDLTLQRLGNRLDEHAASIEVLKPYARWHIKPALNHHWYWAVLDMYDDVIACGNERDYSEALKAVTSAISARAYEIPLTAPVALAEGELS